MTLIGSLFTGPAMGAQGINPGADSILKSMSVYMGGAKAFSMIADIDFEIVATNGQKLQLSSFATALVQRPGNSRK